MTPFFQAVRELRDEMEARLIEALAMAQVQPEAAEKWTAQAVAIGSALHGLIGAARVMNDAPELTSAAAAYFRRQYAKQIVALVERRRQEAKEAHG